MTSTSSSLQRACRLWKIVHYAVSDVGDALCDDVLEVVLKVLEVMLKALEIALYTYAGGSEWCAICAMGVMLCMLFCMLLCILEAVEGELRLLEILE